MEAFVATKHMPVRNQHVHQNQHHTQLVPGQVASQVTTTTSSTTSSEVVPGMAGHGVAVVKQTPVKHVHQHPGYQGSAPTQTTTTTTSTTTTTTSSSEATGSGSPVAQSAGVQGVQSGLQDLYEAGYQQAWASGVGADGQAVPEWGAHSWGVAASGAPVTTAQVQSQVDSVYSKLSPQQQAELSANINTFENNLGSGISGGGTGLTPTAGWVRQAAGQQTAQTQAGPGTPKLVPAGTTVTTQASDSSGSTTGVVTNFIKRAFGRAL
jgi:hypothetical protein